MALTASQKEVLAAAPIQGRYVLALGCRPGSWMWLIGDRPVTRQVNALVRAGLLVTDAEAPQADRHPAKFTATARAVQ